MSEIIFSDALYSTVTSFDKFAALQQEIANGEYTNTGLSFQMDDKRLGLTFAFCLSLLPFLAESRGKTVAITYSSKLLRCMKKIGCLSDISSQSIMKQLTNQKRIIKNVDNISKLVSEIDETAPVTMDERLHEKFTSRVGEMFNNSLEHSESKYTVGSAYFKNNQKSLYCFSCYDTGIGIPEKVIQYHAKIKHETITSEKAFRWALQKGTSTANMPDQPRIPRGLGMGLLKSFAQKNDGAIRICSGNVLYAFDNKKGERYHLLNNSFVGTLFEMDIVKDERRRYILS